MDSLSSLIHSSHHRKTMQLATAARVVDEAKEAIKKCAPHLVEFTQAISLKNGVLTFYAVSSSVSAELYMHAMPILAYVNKHFGNEVVKKIRVLIHELE